MGNRPKSSHMSSTKRLKDTPLNRKPKTKVGLLRQIVECKTKLHRLQTKLEEKYDGVAMDSSPAVRKLNALIRRTSKQLGSLKMKSTPPVRPAGPPAPRWPQSLTRFSHRPLRRASPSQS